MGTLVQDIRFAGRALGKARLFTGIAVICIGLGIGATTTIFSTVNAFLVRPLPFRDDDRVVALYETQSSRGIREGQLTLGNFVDWRRESRTLEGVAVYSDGNYNLSSAGGGAADLVKGASISVGLFPMLGVAPVLGRDFTAEEERPGQDAVVLLSHRLWQRRFGGDSSVLGRTVVVAGQPRTVVGVMPPGWNFPNTHDIWLPQRVDPAGEDRVGHGFDGVGRLRPGVTIEQARADLASIAARLERAHPETNRGWGVSITSFRERLVDEFRTVLLIFLGVVFFVLFIGCANVANLLLARAATRRREMALRTALGAARSRIIRQLLTESVLLGVAGGALGVILSLWGLDVIVAAIPYELPYWMHLDVDWRVLVFAVAVSMLSGAAFGLAPALQLSRPQLRETLNDSGRGSTVARGAGRLRGALVVTEVALSLVLLIAATLMMRSFVALQGADPHFDASNTLTMRLSLAGEAYDARPRRAQYFSRLLERVRSVPGVEAATVVNYVPLEGSNTGTTLYVEGYPQAQGEELGASFRTTADDYLRVLRAPIVAGRWFTPREVAESSTVAVVNATLARRFWPGADAIGHRVRSSPDRPWLTIVGVAPDLRQRKLDERPDPMLYVPYSSSAFRTMTLLVRTTGNPASGAAAVRSAVRSVDASIPIEEPMTMEEIIHRSVWQSRLFGGMFAVFAAIAVLLAAAGVYGVVAYSVVQRTHEIGIRMALGAAARDVVALVVNQGARLALLGVLLGLAGALGLTRLLRTLLYGVAPTDPLTFVLVPLLLGVTALAASWVPARRASRVDPMEALRYE
jgi:putative ABC transport system permease protein